MKNHKSKLFLLSSFLTIFASESLAAGYSTNLYSASALGNSYAGSATGIHDVSDIFFNPATTAGIEKNQLILSASYLSINSDADSEKSTKQDGTTSATTKSSGDSALNAVVPAIYFASPINDQTTFNFAITSPFGLGTEYDSNWSGRYHGLDSSITTINFNPSIAHKLNQYFSFGFGLQAQYAKMSLSKTVELSGSDYFGEMNGSDWGYGYNLGATFQPNKKWKFGIGYRSKMDFKIEGKTKVDGLLYSDFTAKTSTPESVTLGTSFKATDKLELAYDLTWTRWSRLKSFTVDASSSSFPDDTTNFNWRDSVLHSIGANYNLNKKWLLRTGAAYEKDAVTDNNREPRVPNANKIWLSLGFNYKFSDSLSIDSSYMHQIFQTAKINIDGNGSVGDLSAKLKTRADIFSLAIKKEF
jgi:long-chain fatty acid transport protein